MFSSACRFGDVRAACERADLGAGFGDLGGPPILKSTKARADGVPCLGGALRTFSVFDVPKGNMHSVTWTSLGLGRSLLAGDTLPENHRKWMDTALKDHPDLVKILSGSGRDSSDPDLSLV